MAKKYIDIEELIQTLEASCMPIHEKGISGNLGDHKSIADVINNQSVADVEPVRYGKWESTELMHENGCTRCSKCKTDYCVSNLEEIGGDTLPLYCPNCGARMDGDKNG